MNTMILADLGRILFLPVAIAALAFWVFMLVDCANHEAEGSTKIAWVLIILFFGIIGAPLYFFVRKVPRQRQGQYQPPAGLVQPWRRL